MVVTGASSFGTVESDGVSNEQELRIRPMAPIATQERVLELEIFVQL